MKRKHFYYPCRTVTLLCSNTGDIPYGSAALSLLFLLEFSDDGMCSFLCDLKKMCAVHSAQSSHTGVMNEAILECWGLYSYVR